MSGQMVITQYQLQQQMTTKDARRTPTMTLRNSRTHQFSQPNHSAPLASYNCSTGIDSKDLNNLIEDPKEQQINPKNEKESTALPNNEPQPPFVLQHNSRRVTRSSFVICHQIRSQTDLQLEALTPEDNPISKLSEQFTSKKLAKTLSVQSFSEAICLDLSTTVRKPITKLTQTTLSPYSEVRKSYRRTNRNEVESVPYRKCHDAFEGRIVAIINKMQTGKNCLRDLENLLERIPKMSSKDMMNRYVIAGIATILKLSQNNPNQDSKITQKLQAEQKRLRHKILEEFDRFDHFQEFLADKNQHLDSQHYKTLLIRKIYKLMKYRHHPSRELKLKVLQHCSKLINCDTSVASLLKFVRQKADFVLE